MVWRPNEQLIESNNQYCDQFHQKIYAVEYDESAFIISSWESRMESVCSWMMWEDGLRLGKVQDIPYRIKRTSLRLLLYRRALPDNRFGTSHCPTGVLLTYLLGNCNYKTTVSMKSLAKRKEVEVKKSTKRRWRIPAMRRPQFILIDCGFHWRGKCVLISRWEDASFGLLYLLMIKFDVSELKETRGTINKLVHRGNKLNTGFQCNWFVIQATRDWNTFESFSEGN